MERFRREWKFYCTDEDIGLLKNRLQGLIKYDPNTNEEGKYMVHSLYFDDYKNVCAGASDAGCGLKFKWRIRYYDSDTTRIHLEKKQKIFNKSYKKVCELTKKQYDNLFKGNAMEVFWNTKDKTLKKFCIDIATRNFTPKVIIDYERIAYYEPITNVRVTVDTNISAGYELNKFLTGGYQKFPLQEIDFHILEVKFDDILPSYLKNIIHSYGFQQTDFSKYCLGRKKIQEVIR